MVMDVQRRTTASPTWTTYGELRITRHASTDSAPAAMIRSHTVRSNHRADAAAADGGGNNSSNNSETGDTAETYRVQGGHVFEPTPLADILELDDDRHFRLLGRSGDLIHVAGRRSSLAPPGW